MTDTATLVCRVDNAGIVIFVSPEWRAFTAHYDTVHVMSAGEVGQPLRLSLPNEQTGHLFDVLLRKVRQTGHALGFHYHCDTPEVRRHMEMELRPGSDGQVEFHNRFVREEPRPAATVPVESPMIRMCSWCTRIATPVWKEVGEAVRLLRVFEGVRTPLITHGICDTCSAALHREMAAKHR